jgi:hypothetical protein
VLTYSDTRAADGTDGGEATVRLYRNGVIVNAYTQGDTNALSEEDGWGITVGAATGGATCSNGPGAPPKCFAGTIYRAAVYDVALSGHNVLELFSRGSGVLATATVEWTGPQAGCPDVGEVASLT